MPGHQLGHWTAEFDFPKKSLRIEYLFGEANFLAIKEVRSHLSDVNKLGYDRDRQLRGKEKYRNISNRGLGVVDSQMCFGEGGRVRGGARGMAIALTMLMEFRIWPTTVI
ncbi:hypothetical protein Nepgr_012312 [Nepenthes gracilis]|uniref:Uncharacterized protein n=1 Tax=Nepenthes gracilis TaxID=150966 RepID=A0AAD3XN69_NEPGR|nr:hypothetical protein Nepgr_012312 [Nepenthes gracilis]